MHLMWLSRYGEGGTMQRYRSNLNDPQISKNYADTMSKIFTSHFKNYIQAISKLVYSTAKKGDLLGVSEEQRKSTFLLRLASSSSHPYWEAATASWLGSTTKVDLKQQVNVFSLGDRAQILQQIDSPSLVTRPSTTNHFLIANSAKLVQVPHIALQTNQKILFEELYRSYHHLLLDTITYECGTVALKKTWPVIPSPKSFSFGPCVSLSVRLFRPRPLGHTGRATISSPFSDFSRRNQVWWWLSGSR